MATIRIRWLVWSPIIVVVLLLLSVAIGPKEAQSQTNPEDNSSSAQAEKAQKEKVVSSAAVSSRQEDQRVLNYWTKERMKNAKPKEPKAADPSAKKDAQPRAGRPEGPPGKIDPSPPAGGNKSPEASSAQAPLPSATPTAGYTYPFPYTRWTVPLTYYNYYPYRTSGKVFFTENGQNFFCSATVVNSEGKRVVWTAGHRVHGGQGGTFHRNWMFVPAYRDGIAPYGRWTAQSLWSTTGWINSSSFSYDLGAAVINLGFNGTRIANYVGSMGITWNQSYTQNWRAFGYPAQYPFNGQRMYACIAPTATLDYSNGTPAAIGIGCDMNGGASGGGWIIGFNATTGGWVDSVNSYKYYQNQPRAMYGPYHGNATANLYNAVRWR